MLYSCIAFSLLSSVLAGSTLSLATTHCRSEVAAEMRRALLLRLDSRSSASGLDRVREGRGLTPVVKNISDFTRNAFHRWKYKVTAAWENSEYLTISAMVAAPLPWSLSPLKDDAVAERPGNVEKSVSKTDTEILTGKKILSAKNLKILEVILKALCGRGNTVSTCGNETDTKSAVLEKEKGIGEKQRAVAAPNAVVSLSALPADLSRIKGQDPGTSLTKAAGSVCLGVPSKSFRRSRAPAPVEAEDLDSNLPPPAPTAAVASNSPEQNVYSDIIMDEEEVENILRTEEGIDMTEGTDYHYDEDYAGQYAQHYDELVEEPSAAPSDAAEAVPSIPVAPKQMNFENTCVSGYSYPGRKNGYVQDFTKVWGNLEFVPAPALLLEQDLRRTWRFEDELYPFLQDYCIWNGQNDYPVSSEAASPPVGEFSLLRWVISRVEKSLAGSFAVFRNISVQIYRLRGAF